MNTDFKQLRVMVKWGCKDMPLRLFPVILWEIFWWWVRPCPMKECPHPDQGWLESKCETCNWVKSRKEG